MKFATIGALAATMSLVAAAPIETRSGGLRFARSGGAPSRARANVGRNHPDYGLSVSEHLARKAARRAHAALLNLP